MLRIPDTLSWDWYIIFLTPALDINNDRYFQENMGGYNTTMTDLSTLLETHTAQNSRLRDQNAQMASKMGELVGETEKRDQMVASLHEEAQLQIVLLQHQVYSFWFLQFKSKHYENWKNTAMLVLSLVSETLLVCSPARSNNILLFQVQKAQIEKAEIKADMTKERLQLSQDLLLERERAKNLEETVRLLKEQAQIYQVEASSNTIIWPEFSCFFFFRSFQKLLSQPQTEELQAGGASNSKSFQHFKTQIDKLTKSMGQLEKDTANWRQKYEVGEGEKNKALKVFSFLGEQ